MWNHCKCGEQDEEKNPQLAEKLERKKKKIENRKVGREGRRGNSNFNLESSRKLRSQMAADE